MTLTRQLAKYFSETTFESQPPALLHEMKRLLVDFIGVGLAGSQTESGRIARGFVESVGGTEEAVVFGGARRLPAMGAAFANAIAQHSVELDDIDELAYFHYAPPIMSAATAVAQQVGASGAELLNAALSGAEMMARLSRATNPDLRDRGFHTTPACGVFGAAVAASKLLRLDTDQLVSALGLAGAQAGGLMEMYGNSMQKRFNPGPAARDGVVAAHMARLGFTGSDTIIDGERGFANAFAGAWDPDPLIEGLGEEVPVIVEYKPYSCARPIHNAIDCALDVRKRLAGRLDDIVGLVMRRNPVWADYHGNAEPTNFHEAQMSLPYSVAVALIDGNALPVQYATERVKNDDLLRRLTRLVEIVPDSSLPRGVSCHLTVTLCDGTSLPAQVDYPRGSTKNPLDDAALIEKGRSLAGPVIGANAFDDIVDVIMSLEERPNIQPLMDATAAVMPPVAS